MKKPPRRPMERGVSLLPSIFTVGTLACGFYCLLSTLRGVQALTSGGPGEAAIEGFDHAARAIGWAVVFDGLDGRIARMTRTASNFGREFDSMADVVTFGLAPAILAYAWGMRWLTLDAAPGWALRLQPLSWIICFAFLICGAGRLARFNLRSSSSAQTDRRFFIGMPIPGAAGLIAAVVHWAKEPLGNPYLGIAWMAVLALLAFLMISRIRYYSFKSRDLRRRRPYVVVVVVGLIAWSIFLYSEQVLLLIASFYTISGLLYRALGRPQSPPPQPSEAGAV